MISVTSSLEYEYGRVERTTKACANFGETMDYCMSLPLAASIDVRNGFANDARSHVNPGEERRLWWPRLNDAMRDRQ